MRLPILLLALLGAACVAEPALPPLPPAPSQIPPPPTPGHGDFAAGNFARPLSRADAEKILLRTEIFAHGGMNPFPHQEAVELLLKEPDALEVARRIAREGRPAGRLFALCMMKALEEQAPAGPNRPQSYQIQQLAFELLDVPRRITWLESDVVQSPTTAQMVVAILHQRLWRRFMPRT